MGCHGICGDDGGNELKLNGLEITGFVPNLADKDSQLIEFTSSFMAVGGPNGSGKSEFLRRLKACFSGDASNLDERIDPGILVKVSKDYDLGEDGIKFYDDLFIQNIHGGLTNNLSWNFIRSNLKDSPQSIEEFESSFGTLIALSTKLNFDEQLSEATKKISSLAKDYESRETVPTAKEGELIKKIEEVLGYIQNTVVSNDKFLVNYSEKFMNSYELLLVPVGTKASPFWNVYLVNRFLSESIDEVSCFFYLNTLPVDLFSQDIEKAPDFSIKRDTGAIVAGKYSGSPWLAINVGRIEALGFAVVDPDNATLQDLRNAFNSSAANAINWYQIEATLPGEEESEKRKGWAIKRMVALMNSMSDPVTPKQRDHEAIDFFEIGHNNKVQVKQEVHDWLQSQTNVVNELAKLFLPNLPTIFLGINSPLDWATQGIFNITVSHVKENLPLESLSFTQQRWVKFVLMFSLFTYNARRVVLLDEPELGLQRNLESNICEVLEAFAQYNFIVTSSHSSVFLRAPQVIGVKVSEIGERTYTSYFGSLYSHLHKFDISEAEYFESFKLIVVTEGERDKEMLEGFAGDKLLSNEILLISGNGIKSWEGFFSSYIFPMLVTPKILFLVDGFDSSRMNKSIDEAKKLAHKGHPAVKFHFIGAIPGWTDGPSLGKRLVETLAESLTRAVISKDSNRIFFEATGDRDCIEWLPISSFPLKENNWDEVWKAAESGKTGEITTGEDFKNYIKNVIKRENPRLNLKPETLREMAAMAAIQGKTPKRIQKLIERMINISKL